MMSKGRKKISLYDFEQQGGARAAERDGFNREQIMKSLYQRTDGMGTDQRREVVEKFFDREKDGT